MTTFGSLFTGIGGLDLACEAVGWTCAWQVEIDPYCRAVLAKHWPDVPRYEDVRTVTPATGLVPVDVLVGGFPCQDVSLAGSRRGIVGGERSGLWFEFLRLIRETSPRGVIIENVGGLAGRDLDLVGAGLHGAGYAVEVSRVAASDVGAPHRRIRHFIVGFRGRGVADTDRDVRVERRPTDGGEAAGVSRVAGSGGMGHAPGRRGAVSGAVPDCAGGSPAGRPGSGGGRRPLADADVRGREGEREPQPPGLGGSHGDEPHGRRAPGPGEGRDEDGVADAAGLGLEEPVSCEAGHERAPAAGGCRRTVEPVVGRDPHGVPPGLDGPGPGGCWPAPRGQPQAEWEPPRTLSGARDPLGARPQRLKALGNAVVPQQGFVAALRLAELLARGSS